jgi:hypothetical protein
LNRKLTKNALATYIAVLLNLTPQVIVLAFSRAAVQQVLARPRRALRIQWPTSNGS